MGCYILYNMVIYFILLKLTSLYTILVFIFYLCYLVYVYKYLIIVFNWIKFYPYLWAGSYTFILITIFLEIFIRCVKLFAFLKIFELCTILFVYCCFYCIFFLKIINIIFYIVIIYFCATLKCGVTPWLYLI